MQINEYLVTEREQRWCVIRSDDEQGSYSTRKEAIDSSLSLAFADFAEGRFAIVMLDENGERSCLYDSTIGKADPEPAPQRFSL